MEVLGRATALAAVFGLYWAFGFRGLILALILVTAYWALEAFRTRLQSPPSPEPSDTEPSEPPAPRP